MDEKLYKVIITPDAEQDLWNIQDYITYTLMVPETADEYVGEIQEAILKLDYMPEKYSLVEFEPWRSLGMRHFNINNFIVYYFIREDLSSVFIANVIYNKRDQQKALKNRNKR